MFDVLCAGQAVLDCITRGKESEPWKPNVYRSDTIRLHCGGDAVNESIALSGMGLRPAIACGLGKDIAGDSKRESVGPSPPTAAYIKCTFCRIDSFAFA